MYLFIIVQHRHFSIMIILCQSFFENFLNNPSDGGGKKRLLSAVFMPKAVLFAFLFFLKHRSRVSLGEGNGTLVSGESKADEKIQSHGRTNLQRACPNKA